MVRDEFPDAIIVRPSDVFGYADRFFFSYCYQCNVKYSFY